MLFYIPHTFLRTFFAFAALAKQDLYASQAAGQKQFQFSICGKK